MAGKKVRWQFMLALTLTFLVAVSVGGALAIREGWLHGKASVKKVDTARAQRVAPLIDVAPVPIPKALPLIGAEGKTADGYPTQSVDGAGLRSLLWHERWDELDRHFAQFQEAFEADEKHEYWPIDAGAAFASADPSIEPKLDAWVAARPASFAARFARGAHWNGVGWARRGGKWAKDTPASDFASMDDAFRKALVDLDAAIAMKPKLMAARLERMRVLTAHENRGEMRAEVDRATAACPGCFQIRASYLLNTRPRWGGTYAAMTTYASSCDAARNARCRWLLGYVDLDRAKIAREGTKDGASDIERALTFGEASDFLLERARIRIAKSDWQGAHADAERALVVRPGVPEAMFLHAEALYGSKTWEPAGQALLDGLRLDPSDAHAKGLAPDVVLGLLNEAWTHNQAGRREDALRVLDIAAELAPSDREVIGRRAWLIVGTDKPDVPALEAAILKSPDDLRLHQQLDYSLALQGNYARVVEMWTAYITRHPEDARAYLERGGAYHHLKKTAESRADAAKACSLGINEGCLHAK